MADGDEERLAHQTTFLLQEIDGNLNQAYHTTSKIISRVKEYQTHIKSLHSSVQIWKSFFHQMDTVPDPQNTSRRNSMQSALSSLSINDENTESPKANVSDSNSYEIQTPVLKTTRALKNWNNISSSTSSSASKDLSYPEMITTTPYKQQNESFDPTSTPASSVGYLNASSIISTNKKVSPVLGTRGFNAEMPSLNEKENTSNVPLRQILFTPTKKNRVFDDEDDDGLLSTPKMKSPLLSTKLRAMMTPKTPLSNKLATSTAGKTPELSPQQRPEFSLDLFPQIFRKGTAAAQISALYRAFEEVSTSDDAALNLSQLNLRLPSLGTGRIELLLETLVSRNLLRPFVEQDELFWELVS